VADKPTRSGFAQRHQARSLQLGQLAGGHRATGGDELVEQHQCGDLGVRGVVGKTLVGGQPVGIDQQVALGPFLQAEQLDG
jgi:hypothetical protein